MSSNEFIATNVGFGYSTHLLSDINFNAHPGDFIAILGKNGSGKTTFLKLLSGVLNPTTGSIQRPSIIGWKGCQLPMYCPFTVDEILQLHPNTAIKYPAKKRNEIIELFELSLLSNRPLETLSTGEQHRVLTARLFCAHYEALVIDEPLTALDPRQQITISDALSRYTHDNGIVIVASHDIQWVTRTCSNVVAITHNTLSKELAMDINTAYWMDIY
jgi:zinc transport system ATP-binding protein